MVESELRWRVDARRGALVAAPQGRVDETTGPEFGERLNAAVDEARETPSRRLVLDLSGIAYMSSRGLRLLTVARRKASEDKVTILLAGANATMQEILAISRYDQIFQVFRRTEEALPEL